MPDWPTLILSALTSGGITQYPDKNLYNAATMLRPDERPTVPVRLYDNPDPVYQEAYKLLGLPSKGVKGNKNSGGLTLPDGSKIYINRNNYGYKDPPHLASMLAHEQMHVNDGRNVDEAEAYRKSVEVLERFGPQVDPSLIEYYRQRIPSSLAERQQGIVQKALRK